MLGYTLGLRGGWDMVCLTYFVVCGVSRLARFNATASALTNRDTGKVRYFEGTPIPTSILIVALLAVALWIGRVEQRAVAGGPAPRADGAPPAGVDLRGQRHRDDQHGADSQAMRLASRVACSQKVAERVGFEPTVRVSRTHAFQACSFNHSDISPFKINDLRAVSRDYRTRHRLFRNLLGSRLYSASSTRTNLGGLGNCVRRSQCAAISCGDLAEAGLPGAVAFAAEHRREGAEGLPSAEPGAEATHAARASFLQEPDAAVAFVEFNSR